MLHDLVTRTWAVYMACAESMAKIEVAIVEATRALGYSELRDNQKCVYVAHFLSEKMSSLVCQPGVASPFVIVYCQRPLTF